MPDQSSLANQTPGKYKRMSTPILFLGPLDWLIMFIQVEGQYVSNSIDTFGLLDTFEMILNNAYVKFASGHSISLFQVPNM